MRGRLDERVPGRPRPGRVGAGAAGSVADRAAIALAPGSGHVRLRARPERTRSIVTPSSGIAEERGKADVHGKADDAGPGQGERRRQRAGIRAEGRRQHVVGPVGHEAGGDRRGQVPGMSPGEADEAEVGVAVTERDEQQERLDPARGDEGEGEADDAEGVDEGKRRRDRDADGRRGRRRPGSTCCEPRRTPGRGR